MLPQNNPRSACPALLRALLLSTALTACGGGTETAVGDQAATGGGAAPQSGDTAGSGNGPTPATEAAPPASGQPAPDGGSGTEASGTGSGSATPDTGTTQPPDNSLYNLGPTSQAVIDACMSEDDKHMLSQVNDARAVARQCGSDTLPAVPPLAWNCKLEQAALGHSQDMAHNNFFSHTGSDGLGAGDRITNAGYQWRAYGENIAAGYPDVTAVVMGWLDSPGHCRNIMSGNVTELGAASHTNSGSQYGTYWTQDFAAPR